MNGTWQPPLKPPHKCKLPGDGELRSRPIGSIWTCGECGLRYILEEESQYNETWRRLRPWSP